MPTKFPLIESFSRIIHFFRIDPGEVAPAVALLDAFTVRRRKGDTQVWVTLDQAHRESQTRFFLPSVRDYLCNTRASPTTPVCVARKLGAQLANLRTLTSEIDGRQFEFAVRACELYLFGTGIGAIVLELCLERAGGHAQPAVHDLATFNYYLRYVEPHQAPRITLAYRPGVAVPPSLDPVLTGLRTEQGLTLGELTGLLLAPLSRTDIGMRAMDEGAYKVQSFARIQNVSQMEEVSEPFFLLRRVVKDSYSIPSDELELRGHPGVVQSFENIAIGVSLEGFATVVLDTGHPFFAELGQRMRTAYFAHYLLALHQRIALTDLIDAAMRLPQGATRVSPAALAQVRGMRNRAVYFNLHHRLALVSSSTAHEAVYRRLNTTLGIEELERKVRDDVAELEEVLQTHLQEEETNQARLLNVLVACFAVVSILLAIFGMNPAPWGTASQNPHFYSSAAFWAPTAIAAVLLALVLLFGRRRGA